MSNLKAHYFQQLWNSLHALFLNLAHDLHLRQLKNSQLSEPKEAMDLWGQLSEYIENVKVVEVENPPLELVQQSASSEAGSRKPVVPQPAIRHENPAQHLLESIRVTEHPRIKEQMYRSAMDHINTAYLLAHHGDKSGAKLHIELSENAVHTASRFMGDEEYKQFQEKILNRIRHFIS